MWRLFAPSRTKAASSGVSLSAFNRGFLLCMLVERIYFSAVGLVSLFGPALREHSEFLQRFLHRVEPGRQFDRL